MIRDTAYRRTAMPEAGRQLLSGMTGKPRDARLGLKETVGQRWAKATGRPRLVTLNKALVYFGSRGLGLFNHEDLEVSGESRLVARLLGSTESPVVIDVGAHRGLWTRLLLDTVPSARVHTFEPSPGLAAELEGIAGVVSSNAVAVAGAEGPLTFYDDAQNAGSRHGTVIGGLLETIYGLTSTATQVPGISLDHYRRTNDLRQVDYVKIDVEGSEFDVILGAKDLRAAARTIFQFEFSDNHVLTRRYVSDFVELFGDQYQLFRVLPDGSGLPLADATIWQREQFVFQTLVAIPRSSGSVGLV